MSDISGVTSSRYSPDETLSGPEERLFGEYSTPDTPGSENPSALAVANSTFEIVAPPSRERLGTTEEEKRTDSPEPQKIIRGRENAFPLPRSLQKNGGGPGSTEALDGRRKRREISIIDGKQLSPATPNSGRSRESLNNSVTAVSDDKRQNGPTGNLPAEKPLLPAPTSSSNKPLPSGGKPQTFQEMGFKPGKAENTKGPLSTLTSRLRRQI